VGGGGGEGGRGGGREGGREEREISLKCWFVALFCFSHAVVVARVWLSSYFVQGSVVLVCLHLLDKFESSCFAYMQLKYTSWTFFHTSAMARRNNQPLSGEDPSEKKAKNACPFCEKEFL